MKPNPNTDRLALLQFMEARGLTEIELAAQMNWSRAHIHGIVSDVQSDAFRVSNDFKWRFGETFGFAVADLVFNSHATTAAVGEV